MQITIKDRKNSSSEIMAAVTSQMIELMETAGQNWKMPFSSLGRLPVNAVTSEEYRGNNSLLLMLGTEDAEFAGFHQWKSVGATVKKGEKGHIIVRPRMVKDKDDADKKKCIGFSHAYVFGRSQVDNAPASIYEETRTDLTESLQAADVFFNNVGAEVRENDGGRAFYTPNEDFISMPPRAAFSATATSTATECYYGTLAHEHIHWTGRKTRLDRLRATTKADKLYAFEELVAELGASFLCIKLGISEQPRDDHAQYLNSWVQSLKDDPEVLWKAARDAQKAVDFLDNLQQPAAKAA
tara:strand:+ start:342 stop:1232 length:891 start_codon:yes stop_codon:yes gene_type:complete